MTNESIMNKPPSLAPSKTINMKIDEESEDIIELTEIAEDEEQEDTATVLSPKGLYQKLKKELLYIGGMIQEWRTLEDYILAKVEISNELYMATCAMEGRKIDENVAAIREGIHMILKGNQPGFWILGGNYANHINEEAGIILCNNMGRIDEFLNLNKEMEREFSRNEKKSHEQLPKVS